LEGKPKVTAFLRTDLRAIAEHRSPNGDHFAISFFNAPLPGKD
jgi:hypothetical protein